MCRNVTFPHRFYNADDGTKQETRRMNHPMIEKQATGHNAIELAERDASIMLCTYTDPTEEARDGITLEQARIIAAEDPGLIYAVSRDQVKNHICLQSFRLGIVSALDKVDPDRAREYDSLFWGNVHEDDFADRTAASAFEDGEELVEFAYAEGCSSFQ